MKTSKLLILSIVCVLLLCVALFVVYHIAMPMQMVIGVVGTGILCFTIPMLYELKTRFVVK